MTDGILTAGLTEAAERVLRAIGDRQGLDLAMAERHFREVLDTARVHGQAVAVQHLRNRLLAYIDPKSLKAQPDVGIKPRNRPEISAAVAQLDEALLRHFSARLAAKERPPRAGGERVLLLVDHLPARDRLFSHTRQICTYAASLALDPGVEAICILATQETAPENPFRAVAEIESAAEAGWREEVEEIAVRDSAKIRFFTPSRLGPVRPYRETVDFIADFQPTIVFSHEGIFRSRMIPMLPLRGAAVIAVQMNQLNPEPPYADLVLAHGDSVDFAHKPTPAKWRAHSVPLIPFPKEQTMPVEALGPPSPLRVVTVLTLGRLERGLMRDEAAGLKFVIRFLRRFPEAVWLMVAIEDPPAFAARIAPLLPPDVADRLKLLPFVPDLRAVYEHCHIYLHLPPLGGGNMGVAMAIAEGVPVIASKGTDAANTLLPDHTYADEEEAAQLLFRMARKSKVRERVLKEQRQKIRDKHSIEALSVTLRALLADARAALAARTLPERPRETAWAAPEPALLSVD
jgi:glycosyltransferase involved in cell wall biosynthesis